MRIHSLNFLQKTIRQTITLLRAKRTATVLQEPVFVVEANAEKQAKSVIAKTCDEWETIRQHRQIVQLLPQKVDTVVKNLFFLHAMKQAQTLPAYCFASG